MNSIGNFHRRNVGFGKRSRVAKEHGSWNFLEKIFLLRRRHALCVLTNTRIVVHEWSALAVTLSHALYHVPASLRKSWARRKKGTSLVVMTHQTRLVWFTLSLCVTGRWSRHVFASISIYFVQNCVCRAYMSWTYLFPKWKFSVFKHWFQKLQ